MKKILLLLLLLSAFYPAASGIESEEISIEFATNPANPTVGVPTELSFQIIDKTTEKPLTNVNIAMKIFLIEHEVIAFSGNFHSPKGNIDLTYNFLDGSEHLITLLLTPTESSEDFDAITKNFIVKVNPVKPPKEITLKIFSMLLGAIVSGIIVGFWIGRVRVYR